MIFWGSHIPPFGSEKYPLIFITVGTSLHPEVRAAGGVEASYDEHYSIEITLASYLLRGALGEEGYQAAMKEASNLFKAMLILCHQNKKWDGLCYTSEFSEEDPVEWGPLPIGPPGGDVIYGITVTLNCRIKSS